MKASGPRLLEHKSECGCRRQYLHAAKRTIVEVAEIARVARHQCVRAGMHSGGEDRRVLWRQTLLARPCDDVCGRFGNHRRLRERASQARFEPGRLEFQVAPRLAQRVRRGNQLAMATTCKGDQVLGPALLAVRGREDDVGVEKQLQRLRRLRNLRTRVISALVS